ncbi:MAG: hypothetical protein ACPGJV_10655 [Bacteriovoracaceae bacterium]
MEQKQLKINIYGFLVELFLDERLIEVCEKLENDFSFFIDNDFKIDKKMKIHASKVSSLDLIPDGLIASKQTKNSIIYDSGNLRYQDFYGLAHGLLNYSDETLLVQSLGTETLYEVLYLAILSRSGKYLDTLGFHKIHACAVSKNNKNIILMLPSKGGKTSTFLKLLEDPEVCIISDDTPLISPRGELLPFPLRVGVEDKEDLYVFSADDIYEFQRRNYSKKYLLSLKSFPNEIKVAEKNILVIGVRTRLEKPSLRKVSGLYMFFKMIEHMVIGNGLPMIVEYFLRAKLKDNFTNLKILVSRSLRCTKLILNAKRYEIYLSKDIEKNAKLVKSLL